MKEITIPRPDDFHVHLRWGEMLLRVIRYTAGPFARALIMPNVGEDGIVDADPLLVQLMPQDPH